MKISLIVTIFLLSITFPSRSAETETSPDPVLTALQAQIERELHELEPMIGVDIPEHYAGKSLILRYKTRKYMVYPGSKSGRLGRELEEKEGPDDEGILLRVHVQAKGEVNQAVVPQTIDEPYWKTFLNVYPIKNAEKQIYVALSYRSRTDKDLISKLKSIAEQVDDGQPATRSDPDTEGPDKPQPESEGRSR